MRRGLEALAWIVALGALVLISGDLFWRGVQLRAENRLLERYGAQPITITGFTLGDTVAGAHSATAGSTGSSVSGRELLLIASTPCYACAKALASWRRLVADAAWRQGDSVTWVSVGDGEIPVSLRDALAARGVPWRSLQVRDLARFETTTGIAVAPVTLLRVGEHIVHIAAGAPSERMQADLRERLAATGASTAATFTRTTTVERLIDILAAARATELGSCVAYDARQLTLVEETGAAAGAEAGGASGSSRSSTWIVRDTASAQAIAHAATRADAERVLTIARRHRGLCAIGEGRAHPAAVLRYWQPLVASDNTQADLAAAAQPDARSKASTATTEPRGAAQSAADAEDCLSYDADAVGIESDAPERWKIVEGRHLVSVLTTEQDAKLAWRLMVRHRARCFIGRGNTQRDQARYITQYWK